MILSNALRYFLTFLSFPSNLKSEKLSEVQKTLIKDLKAKSEYLINSGIKNDKLNTHKIFSNSVLSLIRSGNLNNFLRRGFIQKMFFVHNRFYNYLFLFYSQFFDKLRNIQFQQVSVYFLHQDLQCPLLKHIYEIL